MNVVGPDSVLIPFCDRLAIEADVLRERAIGIALADTGAIRTVNISNEWGAAVQRRDLGDAIFSVVRQL